MTISPAHSRKGALLPSSLRASQTATPAHLRTNAQHQHKHPIEISGLNADGSTYFDTLHVPSLPVFLDATGAFAQGTLIMTDTGEVAVEDLQPGDSLTTSAGHCAKIMWIGSRSFAPERSRERSAPLVRVMDDAFGTPHPAGFMTLGPSARILHTPAYLRGQFGHTPLMTPIREFLDGVNVIEVTPPTPVRLFHIVLERHAAIKANGLQFETFHPGHQTFSGQPYAIRDLFLSMFPHLVHLADFGPLAHPRAPMSKDIQPAAG